MCKDPGHVENEEKLIGIKAVLKPSIVGLGPKELYVQPLWSNNNPLQYNKIKIKNNFYFATKKSNSVIHSSYTYTRQNTSISQRNTPLSKQTSAASNENHLLSKRISFSARSTRDASHTGNILWKPLSKIVSDGQTSKEMHRRTRPLDLYGLSKNSFEGLHPLPEKPEEPYHPFSPEYSDDGLLPFNPEDSEGRSLSTPSSPNTSSFSNGFFNGSISSSVGTGGNITTGRSSVYSWGHEDEFDKKAASQVRTMFDEVDCCLFENISHQMKEECGDWVTSFPYLRLLGNQIMPSEESGVQIISNETESVDFEQSNVNDMLEDVETETNTEFSILSVSGQKVEAIAAPSYSTSHALSKMENEASTPSNALAYLEEEVFAMNGEIVEFIAYDDNINDIKDSKDHKQKKHRAIPPITPPAFVRETVLNECFDNIWIEIVDVLKHLLKLYIRARARKEMERHHANFDSNMDRFLESALELPQSRDSYYGRQHRFPSQLRLKVGSGMFNNSSDLTALKELMTIRSVALQNRAPSVAQHMIPEEDATLKDPVNSRPVSSTVGAFRQFPKTSTFRAAEQQFYHRMLSAKVPKRTMRLQPLQPPKTAGHVENNNIGEVRGTRLTTAGDRQSALTINNLNQQLCAIIHVPSIDQITEDNMRTRNGVLPPLDRLGTADTTASYQPKNSKRKNRTVSAASNDSKNLVLREKTSFSTLPDSRPNTIQSFVIDQPFNKLKLRDSLQSLTSKTSHQLPSNYHDNTGFLNVPLSKKSFPLEEESQEFDDLVLWGHGPPLISHQQQRKRKSFGSTMR